MSLTLESEQRLIKGGLVTYFTENQARWLGFVQRSYAYVKEGFPQGATVRRDDVAKALLPMLEVDPELLNVIAVKKLKEKYWVRYFGDLILDRCWEQVVQTWNEEGQG